MLVRRPIGLFVLSATVLFACGRSESPAPSTSTAPGAASSTSATKPPFGVLNTPAEGESVKLDPQKPIFGTGWALADSGVADVSAVFDDGQKAYVKMGFAFPGVKDQFPTYADADRAGYMFGIPKLSAGQHSVTVTVTAKDGSTTRVERHFTIP